MKPLSDFLECHKSYSQEDNLDLIQEVRVTPEEREITEWMKTQLNDTYANPKNFKCKLNGDTLEVYGYRKAGSSLPHKTLSFIFNSDITSKLHIKKLEFMDAEYVYIRGKLNCGGQLTITGESVIELRIMQYKGTSLQNVHIDLPKEGDRVYIEDGGNGIRLVNVIISVPKGKIHHDIIGRGVTNPDVIKMFKDKDLQTKELRIDLEDPHSLDKDSSMNPFAKNPIQIDDTTCKSWSEIGAAYKAYNKSRGILSGIFQEIEEPWLNEIKEIYYDWARSMGFDLKKKNMRLQISCRHNDGLSIDGECRKDCEDLIEIHRPAIRFYY